MPDILCIGTTGMLAGCVRSLIARGDRVACLARTPASLENLTDSIPRACRALLSTHPCDYHDHRSFGHALRSIGFTPDAAICWVHSPAEPVINEVYSHYPHIDLLRVVGSSNRRPHAKPGCTVRIVRLGFITEPSGSRWLSHDEISDGVLSAFDSGRQESIVGQDAPWDQRPS